MDEFLHQEETAMTKDELFLQGGGFQKHNSQNTQQ